MYFAAFCQHRINHNDDELMITDCNLPVEPAAEDPDHHWLLVVLPSPGVP